VVNLIHRSRKRAAVAPVIAVRGKGGDRPVTADTIGSLTQSVQKLPCTRVGVQIEV
jgi:hypothetical protein